MAFEGLSDRLQNAMTSVSRKGKITPWRWIIFVHNSPYFYSEHSKITNKAGMRFNYNFVSLRRLFTFS